MPEFYTFSCISEVLCASQNATVATSFRIGISIEQSRPSSSATSGRGAIGPLLIGPRTSILCRFGNIIDDFSIINYPHCSCIRKISQIKLGYV